MKIKLVEIQWHDAEAAKPGWNEDDHEDDLVPLLKSYGLLVRQTPKWVIHASTYDPETERWSEMAKIPKGMVKKITTIKEVDV